MARCLLALGANLGDRAGTLDKALTLISDIPGVELVSRSSWHETVPVGGPAGQGNFLNGAVVCVTSHLPQTVARSLGEIEEMLGRDRKVRWNARTLDIDMLLFDGEVIADAALRIPHPRMSFRQFVLAPATEIAGEMVHPTSGWTIAALLHHWRTARRRVAIAGNDSELSQWLREAILEELDVEARDRNDGETIELVSMNEEPSMVIALHDSRGAMEPRGHMGPICPIVRIGASDHTAILPEALAAIQAAWPD